MALRSSGRKFSFEILTSASSLEEDDFPAHRSHMTRDQIDNPNRKKKKKKKKQHLDRTQESQSTTIPEDPITESASVDDATGPVINGHAFVTVGNNGSVLVSASVVSSEVATVTEAGGGGCRGVFNNSCGELRQRNVNNNGGEGEGEEVAELVSSSWGDESGGLEVSSAAEQMPRRSEEQPSSGSLPMTKLETAESLDWNKLMAKEDPNYLFSLENSPVKYLMDEICKGNSLKSTTNLGSEKEREKVYDTIFRLPWRCEVLIDVGFFVCLDSFLSLLTIMPTRLVMTLWRFLNTRQFKKLSAAELSDIGCFFVLASGVALLEQTDISLIYHMIRGQGTIKLYVVYNVLEIFDKLCQSFVGDVLQTLFSSAEGLASCSPENMGFWIWRFIYDQALSMAVSILHSFILLAQAITLSTCIVAHNNALLALLVSNNFAEIKSSVFKRFSKENIHNLVYSDSVERFHISAFLLFVLAQNILEAEGPWFESFLFNALLVFLCEMLIDIIKHSFLAKFNDIKPIAYSEFLEDLCNQTLNIQTEEKKKNLTFVPLAPACVVIRVLTPVYAAHLPYTPIPWRLFWILLLSAMTYVMLTSLKVMIGMGLQKHATWYVNRCRKRKHHLHAD